MTLIINNIRFSTVKRPNSALMLFGLVSIVYPENDIVEKKPSQYNKTQLGIKYQRELVKNQNKILDKRAVYTLKSNPFLMKMRVILAKEKDKQKEVSSDYIKPDPPNNQHASKSDQLY